MTASAKLDHRKRFLGRIERPAFPCVGAKSAASQDGIEFFEAGDLRCPEHDAALLRRLQDFASAAAPDALFVSLVALFPRTPELSEANFESALWQRLQALHALDVREHGWDPAVSSDPESPRFSMSLGGRAFYVIGVHPGASRKARRFASAALVFNLHSQFELLREDGRYDKMRAAITERDIAFSGSRNPMLKRHGEASEARQYSGRVVGSEWRCPFSAQSGARVPMGRFERLPKWLDLVPMVLQWGWLGLRYGSFTLPSTVAPGITSGGLVGEGKLEYFETMGALARSATAEFIGVRNERGQSAEIVGRRMAEAGLQFPVVAKPDIGWCGYGVRLLQRPGELAKYLGDFPQGETFLLQRYLPEPGEAGLFYARHPDQAQGELIGIVLRDYPEVVGNGRDDIATLVQADPRLRRSIGRGGGSNREDPARVPAEGERVRLSTVASMRVGGCYRDGSALSTPALVRRVDAIAGDMGCFLVGRFDVRFADLAGLQRGEFTIMEVNGAGSEAVHAWDPKYTLREGYGIVFAKQRRLFAIADAMRRRGVQPIGVGELARLWHRQNRLTRLYPASN